MEIVFSIIIKCTFNFLNRMMEKVLLYLRHNKRGLEAHNTHIHTAKQIWFILFPIILFIRCSIICNLFSVVIVVQKKVFSFF